MDARAAFFSEARGHTPFVAAEVGNLTFIVSTADETVGGKLFAAGVRRELRTLEHAIEHLGSTRDRDLLDVGANIGTTTLPALAGHFARAVAVEPEPGNALLLKVNALLNGMDERLTVIQAALSAERGESSLLLDARNSGGHVLGAALDSVDEAGAAFLTQGMGEAPASVVVTVETIDHLVESGVVDLARLGLVWMDAEGSEPAILRGAATVLDRRVPLVMEVMLGQRTDWLTEVGAAYPRVVNLRSNDAVRPGRDAAALVGRARGNLVDLLFF